MLTPSIVLELLDGERGYVVQSWEFPTTSVVQIGRSRECDVVVGSPVVSRNHACLRFHEGRWELHSVSQQGIVLDGKLSNHCLPTDGTIFRLSRQGPYLRFRMISEGESAAATRTISFDAAHTPMLVVNEAERDREVDELARTDFFQELKRRAAALRHAPRTNQS